MNHSETITPKWKVKRQRLSSFLNPNQAWCYWPHFCILLVLFMTLYICSFLIYKKSFHIFVLFLLFSHSSLQSSFNVDFIILFFSFYFLPFVRWFCLWDYASICLISISCPCLVLDPNFYTNFYTIFICISYPVIPNSSCLNPNPSLTFVN